MTQAGSYCLYGDSRSGNCYKVAWMLRLAGLPFTWRETDVLRSETRREDFLAMNPNGKVPLLILPDGRPLAESNAMLLHLAEGSRLLPADTYQRALVYQWLFFEQYSHEPYIAVARFLVKLAGRQVEEAERLVTLRERGNLALRVMEGHLTDHEWFVSQFSVADIALYAYTHTAEDGGFSLREYSAIRNWLRRVEQKKGFVSMAEACS